MTYEEMERELSEIPKFGAKASLENLAAYLKTADHPEKKLRVIHVAGTNGKGSVCAFTDSILRRAGYKTALFTSPHLIKINERFRINFAVCEDGELVNAWERVKELMQKGQQQGLLPLTYFEILFLMAMLLFSEKDIDYCILETGLGGRFDATSLADPVLSVITSISYDHMEILGDTIEKIAFEKAGIIKPGIPVVTIDEENGAFPVIKKQAAQKKAPLYPLNAKELTILKKYENNIDFSIDSRYYKICGLKINSTAVYQVQNAALAALAVKVLLPELPEEFLREGLLSMCWEGRMEEITDGVYVDGAHNPGAISRICESLAGQKGRWRLLFAVCGDKDYSSMIHMLGELPWTEIYITKIDGTRGASADEVRRCFAKETKNPLYVFETVREALEAALRYRKDDERLLCLGSLYLVGEIKEYWKARI